MFEFSQTRNNAALNSKLWNFNIMRITKYQKMLQNTRKNNKMSVPQSRVELIGEKPLLCRTHPSCAICFCGFIMEERGRECSARWLWIMKRNHSVCQPMCWALFLFLGKCYSAVVCNCIWLVYN